MANYANLKAAIDAVIKANGQQEITGPLLNQVLKAMVNALGAGYLFMGIAEHDTNPNTPDQNVFYIALEEGTYTHFGNAQVHFGISLLFWYGQWSVYNLVTFSNTVTDEVEEIPTSYAVFNALKDAAVYDVTAHSGQRFANLYSLLSSPDIDTLIPPSVRKAGMTIMFTSPAHYVQQQSQLFKHKFFFNAVDMSLFTNVNRWIGIETTVTQYSLNVPTSGAVFAAVNSAKVETIAEAGVYDVTANNDGATFASLSALLNDEGLDTLIPVARRKGGMSIKFVLTSDNQYIQCRLMANEFSTDVEDWEEDASIEKLEGGDIIPKLAQNLESWEGREDLTVNSTWSEPVRTTAGDASIVSSKGGKLVSIVPRSDFYASALRATGFNLLRNAVQIEGTTKYYFLVPKLIFGTFGTADEPNGVLFTNAQGEKMTPTVYFKKLSDGVPTSSNYGSACTYTTSNGYRFYTCSEIGYMVVDGVTLASTCAHIAWSRRYDDYVAIDAAGDEGSSVSLAAIFTALHAANQPALFITNGVRDYIEFTNTTAVWHRVCNKVTVSSWTNTEVPSEGGGASTYIHSASISGMKSGGVARIGSMMLSVDGTTVSFTDSNPTAAAADVVYELATQASGTVAVTPTYSLEDWGLEYLDGVTGVAEVTTQYCRNYPDSLAALAQFDFKDLSLVVGEALAELFFDVQAIKANMMRYTSLIDEYGYPVRMGQRIFDLTDGAPTEIPMSIGLVRMDASTGHVWISKSLTISTSDWKQVQ